MASITIAFATIPNWQRDSDVQLRIYALEAFIAADGTMIAQGSPDPDEALSGNFFAPVTCSLSGSNLTISAATIESTTDSQDNPHAQYAAYFFTTEGEMIGPFGEFASFVLPASPTSTTWPAIEAAQADYL